MFGFTKKMSIGLSSTCIIGNFGNSRARIKCVSLNNLSSQARPTLVNVNSNEPLYYLFNVSVDKCGESCNTIDNPYTRVYVPNEIENINAKGFNLISRVNETRFLDYHESCECKCRLNESVCNSMQKIES